MAEITLLLRRWASGEPGALEALMPLVYPRLRELAAAHVRREQNPDLLQPTMLVHELYLRLADPQQSAWEDRRHFFAFAARAMRSIVIDHARAAHAQMRGGGATRVPLTEELLWVDLDSPELLDLDRALTELQAIDPGKVQLLELRYFLGCTAEETASLVQRSKATVDREVRFARTWLYRRIHPEAGPTGEAR